AVTLVQYSYYDRTIQHIHNRVEIIMAATAKRMDRGEPDDVVVGVCVVVVVVVLVVVEVKVVVVEAPSTGLAVAVVEAGGAPSGGVAQSVAISVSGEYLATRSSSTAIGQILLVMSHPLTNAVMGLPVSSTPAW
ncbi:hypothetical protein PMAYCL1PPCAC_09157, partial [Pristionchus mayeri]